jgi:hypothetical protein
VISEPIQEVVESDESVVVLFGRLIREGERPMWKAEHRIAHLLQFVRRDCSETRIKPTFVGARRENVVPRH